MEDNAESKKQIVLTPERIASTVIDQARWKRVLADPQVKEGLKAAGRTLINTGIAAGELIPFLGEVGSWGADAAKIVTRFAKQHGVELHLDLTPDVPLRAALLSEIPDLVTLGGSPLPLHAIEGGLQLKADIPRMREALNQARSILKGELDGYKANKSEIDQAMNVFGIEPPSNPE